MKRIISALLTVTLLLGSMVIPASAASADSEQFTQKAETLIGLNILGDQSASNLKPFSKMKKYQLVNYIYALFTENKHFNGVNADAAAFAESKGIIGSAADINASEELTLDVALKMIVEALGYGVVAQVNGGYPEGYRSKASELELLDGVSALSNEQLKLTDVVSILYNAIDCNIMTVDLSDGRPAYESVRETILEHNRKIYRTEGVVNGNYYTSLWSVGDVKQGDVYIGSEIYSAGKTDAENMVGYPVSAYYKETDAGNELLYIGKRANKYNEMTIDAEDIDSVASNLKNISYYSGNKKQSVKLENVTVLYNGQHYGECTAQDLEIEKGSLTLIDNNNSGSYNIIKVESIETMLVDAVNSSEKKIYNKYSYDGAIDVLDLTNEDESASISITNGTQSLSIGDLKEWDVLSVKRTKGTDRRIFKISVCAAPVTGKAELVDYKNGKIVIDGVDYTMAKSLINAYNYRDGSGNNFTYSNIGAGKNYTFYMDSAEEIVAAKTATQTDVLTGYAKNISYKSGAEEGFIRLFNEDQEWITYQLADEVKHNGKKKKASQVYSDEMSKGGGSFVQGLSQYKLDEDGKIYFLETPVADDGDTESGRMRYKTVTGEYRYNDNSNGSRYYFQSATYWIIPAEANRDNESLYAITKDRLYLPKDKNYEFTMYNLDEWNFTNTTTVVYDNSTKTPVGNFFVVTEVGTEYTSGEELVQSIVGSYQSYDKLKLTAEEVGLFDSLKPGDVLSVNPNKNGEIMKVNGYKLWYSVSEGKKFYNSDELYSTGARMTGEIVKVDADGKRMIINNGIENITRRWLDAPYIVVYNKQAELIERIPASKLAPGDFIVYREFWATISDIVAIRE